MFKLDSPLDEWSVNLKAMLQLTNFIMLAFAKHGAATQIENVY